MSISNFQDKLKKYAELIVKVGANVQKDQTVIIYVSVTQQELAHLIVEEAYKLGASDVIVKWNDDFVNRQFLAHASQERLENIPDYIVAEGNYLVDKKAARITIVSSDPDAFVGLDQNRIATYQAAHGKALRPLMRATANNELAWTFAGAADQAWAEKVFPELKGQEAIDRLWEEIFKTTRMNEADPIQAWDDHDRTIHAKADWLNKEQFSALHYTSPITDLTIGLPKNHLWTGASAVTDENIAFMPNMPTEEVFTAPDCRRINGHIRSTKPLSYAGSVLEGMEFTFKDGKIIKATAEKGQDILEHLIATDEGSLSLGEAALVPDPSPISQSGITFFETLFDENASNHLAIGASYPFSLQNGTNMSDEELAEAGMNVSQTHVDFMVGSADMNIDGIKEDGTIVPIFRNGDWA
ncbi:aminopeptidase [Ligilactobacillus ceti]|uniref:Aminopeptidase PepS n=1 Tax=Ligilactobacillus ceti DSM 22408 TaxID=1122146 RepID=A0A0R2KRJ3_9LACO|nr:aminopeptidase [Ligilactobacillus ceti]KRN90358.1 aminopeptidase PepS [Ligilactobacillus ceti DSM 22408]